MVSSTPAWCSIIARRLADITTFWSPPIVGADLPLAGSSCLLHEPGSVPIAIHGFEGDSLGGVTQANHSILTPSMVVTPDLGGALDVKSLWHA